MLKPSDFNNAVPQFQNGNYASNPINPQYVEEPSSTDYNRGTEPLQTLPAQWWNWFINKFTSRFNKVNIYVKNLFNELAQLLSLVNVTPDGTESSVTDGQLKNAFKELYPDYINTKLALESTYVKKTQKVNNHALSGDIAISKADVGLGNVADTGDSANASSGGTTKFTTGGAYNLLSSIAPYFSASTTYAVGALITYQNKLYECTTAHSAGAWNASHFTARSVQYVISNYILPSLAPTFSTSTAYAVGTFVTYQNKLYRCKATHSAGAWNTSHFELANINNITVDTDGKLALKADLLDLAPAFSASTSYAVGDYVTYNGNMYRCTVAHSGAWNASDFTLVTVGSDLALKSDKTSLALPTDAVLHYSFDEVPDYPDGTASYKKIKDFTSTSGWVVPSDFAISVENNCLKIISNNTNRAYMLTRETSVMETSKLNGKLVKLKIRSSYVPESINFQEQVAYRRFFLSLISKNGDEYVYAGVVNFSVDSIVYLVSEKGSALTSSDYCIIEAIYIGDGSYSTPIIDNANGQNNATNNGGLAVQGVSGKGAYFLNGKYADVGTSFQLNANFSMSVWAKADNVTSRLNGNIFGKSTQFILRNGASFPNGDYFMLYLYDENGTNLAQGQDNIGDLLPNEWTHIVIVRENTTLKSYRNGVLNKTITLANSSINKNTNACFIGSSGNTRPQSIDDLLIFDRALTENEVMALYLNKANTPKYYGEVPVTRKVNGHTLKEDLTLVKEDVGLGNVSNTGDSATPVSGGATKFTTGGAYNLLTSLAPIFSASTSYAVGDMVTYNGRLYTCTTAHSGAWNASHFTVNDFNSFYNFTGGIKDANVWTERIFKDRLCKNWTLGTGFTLFNQPIHSICYGNNLWVASTGDKKLIWSKDGKAWTEGAVLQEYIYKIIYANNLWVAVGNNLTAWSNNGKSWTTTAQAGHIEDVLYANNLWVATSLGSFWWSENGKDWVEGSHYSDLGYEHSLGYKDGVWVAFEKDIYNSTDGKTWQKLTSDGSITVGCYGNGEWLAINKNKVYKSKDGINWDSSTTGAESISRLIYGNGVYIKSATNSASYSIDGNYWYSLQGNYNGVINTQAICYNNGLWVASASSDSANIVSVSYDGILWFSLSLHNNNTYAKRGKTVYYANGMWLIGTFDNAIYWSSFENAI